MCVVSNYLLEIIKKQNILSEEIRKKNGKILKLQETLKNNYENRVSRQ